MDERILKFRVGIVVLTAIIVAGILIIQFGELQLPGTSKYTIYIDFQQAPGITRGNTVRGNGFLPSGGSGMSSRLKGYVAGYGRH